MVWQTSVEFFLWKLCIDQSIVKENFCLSENKLCGGVSRHKYPYHVATKHSALITFSSLLSGKDGLAYFKPGGLTLVELSLQQLMSLSSWMWLLYFYLIGAIAENVLFIYVI
jgi:hypothetical protein